jgi:predicted PurR-regulated permease PerM
VVTILKLLAAVLLSYLAIQLWPLLALLFLALLIAITLFPILQWVRRHRWPDWVGILVIGLLVFVSMALFAGILIPTIGNEGAGMIEKLPSFQKEVVDRCRRQCFAMR